MIRRHFLMGEMGDNQETIPVIKYTTSDGSMFDMLGILNYWLSLGTTISLGAYVVSNTYDGIGLITLSTIIDRTGYCEDTLMLFPIFTTSIFSSDIDITKLTSVDLPNTITHIGDMTFLLCTGLQSVTLPTQVESIGKDAFQQCTSLTSITIPESVKSIGAYAFDGCTSLTSITVPNSVTSIGNAAFSSCYSLTYIVIGNGVTSIGERTFLDCTSLTSILIPNSVVSIEDFAFANCTSLKNVVIGSGVSSDYYQGAYGAWFFNCPNIESIVVDNRNPKYDSRDNCNAIVKTNTNSIIQGCKNTKIVDSIEHITTDSFKGITMDYLYVGKSIKTVNSWPEVTNIHFEAINIDSSSLTLPPTLTTCTFGEDVETLPSFKGTAIRSIIIPPKITSISGPKFLNCTSLQEIFIPKTVTKITLLPFKNTNLYKNVYYEGTIEDWCAITFTSSKLLGNLYINNDQLVENLTIPDTIITIGVYTFQNCPSIKSVVLHNNITTINSNAFSDCINLQTINYEGTMAEWGLITLGSNWNLNVPAKVVHCTDGDVEL